MEHKDLLEWLSFVSQGQKTHLAGVRVAAIDRLFLLKELYQWGSIRELPLYFWNPGYKNSIQEVRMSYNEPAIEQRGPITPQIIRDANQYPQKDLAVLSEVFPSSSLTGFQESITLEPSGKECKPDVISEIVSLNCKGIFVIEGLLKNISSQLNFELRNAHFELEQRQTEQFLILTDDLIELPLNLYPFIPVLEYSFPRSSELRFIVDQFCQQYVELNEPTIDAQRPLVRACVGLPRGEIDLVLQRALAKEASLESMADFVMEYKRHKLQGRGLQIIPEPEVPVAAGMDLLDETLEKVRKLFEPEAQQRHLRPPKAMLLWGIPGTGKSLGAALAAKKIGATLVACDWSGLVASTVSESLANLEYVFKFLGEIGNAIFFIDEFEKANACWDSGAEGGIMAKMAGRLLTWMQNHTEPVMMVATINRLEMLPPEMIRRFEIVHFFGLPHAGALYEIFQVHLQRYFQNYSFMSDEWRILLREYSGCTPAEIGVAVRHVADNIYCSGREATVTLQDLLSERNNFKPASATQVISNQMAAIAQLADFALPVSSPDTSVFARPERMMFQSKDNPSTKSKPTVRVNRPPAAVEDI